VVQLSVLRALGKPGSDSCATKGEAQKGTFSAARLVRAVSFVYGGEECKGGNGPCRAGGAGSWDR
jgi:hypothetical protein